MPGPKPMTAEQIILRNLVDSGYPDPDCCWVWQGLRNGSGYGRIQFTVRPNKQVHKTAHRVAYEVWIGEIPDHHVLDHLCANRLCCNPAHLDPVLPQVNWSRGNRHAQLGLKPNVKQPDKAPTLLDLIDESDAA